VERENSHFRHSTKRLFSHEGRTYLGVNGVSIYSCSNAQSDDGCILDKEIGIKEYIDKVCDRFGSTSNRCQDFKIMLSVLEESFIIMWIATVANLLSVIVSFFSLRIVHDIFRQKKKMWDSVAVLHVAGWHIFLSFLCGSRAYSCVEQVKDQSRYDLISDDAEIGEGVSLAMTAMWCSFVFVFSDFIIAGMVAWLIIRHENGLEGEQASGEASGEASQGGDVEASMPNIVHVGRFGDAPEPIFPLSSLGMSNNVESENGERDSYSFPGLSQEERAASFRMRASLDPFVPSSVSMAAPPPPRMSGASRADGAQSLIWTRRGNKWHRIGYGGVAYGVEMYTLGDIAGLSFQEKRDWFRCECEFLRVPESVSKQSLNINRSTLLDSSLNVLRHMTTSQLRSTFTIKFTGEPGLDVSGLLREWFNLCARDIFDVRTSLFEFSDIDNLSLQISPLFHVQDESAVYFDLAGRFLGKALFDGVLIPVHLVRSLYKHLLCVDVRLEDLQAIDTGLHDSLGFMLQNPVDGIFFETFSVSYDEFGVVKTVDLVPGGIDIDVTDENKEDYVAKYVRWRLYERVREPVEALRKGFLGVVPAALVSVFDCAELELIMCGVENFDVDDWKAHTEYRGYVSSSPQIQWFWSFVWRLSDVDRGKLLQFVSGTSRIPVQGFSALESRRGEIRKFTIERLDLSM
jgi:hypothetical protein